MIYEYRNYSIAGILILVVIIALVTTFSSLNRENQLRQAIKAKQQSVELGYDKMWKTVKEQQGITSDAEDKFKEFYIDFINSSVQNDQNLLVKLTNQVAPNYPISLRENLFKSLEFHRNETKRLYDELLDLSREHNTLLGSFPSGIILNLFGRQPIEIRVVKSERTNKAFESGNDEQLLYDRK